MKKTTLFLILLMGYGVTFAQKVRKPISPILGWSHALQQKDYLMGFDIGIPNNDRNIHYFLSFDFRPHGRKVQEFAGGICFTNIRKKGIKAY